MRRSGVYLVVGKGGAGGDAAAGGFGVAGYAQVHRGVAPGGDLVHLGEFDTGAGEADREAFGLAEPAVVLGFGDAGDQVVTDLDEPGAFGGVGPQ
jgi:hypothetical protein